MSANNTNTSISTGTSGMSLGAKKLIIIVVAVLIALFAAFQGYRYIQTQRSLAEARQKIESYLMNGEFDKLSDELKWKISSGSLMKCYPNTSTFLDMLLEHCKVYVVQPGLGGYYDGYSDSSSSSSKGLGVEGMESIGTQTRNTYTGYCGDFQAGTTYVTDRYDGLVDDVSKSKYNKTRGFDDVYCRGEKVYGKIDSNDLKAAVKDGAQYILCGQQGRELDTLLLISEDKIYALKNALTVGGFYEIKGDFSKELEKVAAAYQPD
ncbi:hypothetical protein D1646_03720 [Pseudoflavonifractor sp. 60]|uniref:hypothetical protein n=1 Tax=Pseudoflavonifractor sp. 60 TaxID=2304576 RepID=UPI00136902AD|nr:hypothetical protein [Pseudoflavonifractor sp. 60]NBI65933.1 hypothetical protein [Pseudoflavonifractor sp. 60]